MAALSVVALVALATWVAVRPEGATPVPRLGDPGRGGDPVHPGEGPMEVPSRLSDAHAAIDAGHPRETFEAALAEPRVDAAEGKGVLNGYVVDQFTGRPLSHYKIQFLHTTEQRERSTRADESGFYEVSLGAGEWNVLVQDANRRIRTTSGRSFGPYEVVAQVTATQDLLLVGERTISGNLLLSAEGIGQPEEAANLLFLRLLDAKTGDVVGLASTETFASPPWGSEAKSEEPVDVESYKMGAFAFSFIEPKSYLLHVSTTPKFSTRRKGGDEIALYLELKVEVNDQDVRVPDRTVSVQEIASASLLRARGAE